MLFIILVRRLFLFGPAPIVDAYLCKQTTASDLWSLLSVLLVQARLHTTPPHAAVAQQRLLLCA